MGAANLVASTLVAYAPYTAAKKVTRAAGACEPDRQAARGHLSKLPQAYNS